MKGIELARGYYEEYGKPMLEKDFADILPLLAVGFTGRGSEHYGFDDEVSTDHDFEPGFIIFIPDEDIVDSRTEFRLERAYAKLPEEYMGVKRLRLSPVGGNRNGVKRISDYYADAIGSKDGVLSTEGWLRIPDYALAEAVNGEIFYDGPGVVTSIRKGLLEMPTDILRKRLAGNILLMAQSGQYNYVRCIKHGEYEAAQLACNEFVNAAMKTLFLLDGRYMPFYKWSFRALRESEGTRGYADDLAFLLNRDIRIEEIAKKKYEIIEDISSRVISVLIQRNLSEAVCGDLEKHAYSVNEGIKDIMLRMLNILTAV